jgi:acetolactate synthase-1/2/3 large subunit
LFITRQAAGAGLIENNRLELTGKEMNKMLKLSGGQAIVKMLENLGVERAFGVPGFQALPYYMAILHSKKMKHVLVRNEQAGAFAADAYFRACGKVAVCDGTCGPGATNLITGFAESYFAAVPVLGVTSNVVSSNEGRGANMEAPQDEAIAHFAKDVIMIREVKRVPELVRKAFHTAVEGRPGPVLIDMPEDIYYDEYEFDESEFKVYDCNTSPVNRFIPELSSLRNALEVIKNAQNPVMLCGGGIHNSGAQKEVQEFAELLSIPVATTISGKGSIPENHPLSINLFGRYFRFANEFIKRADVIVVAGSKLAEMSTIRWSLIPGTAKIVHIEIEPTVIGKVYSTAYPLIGDAKATLGQMIEMLKADGVKKPEHHPVYDEIKAAADKWRAEASEKIDDAKIPVNIAHMLDVLHKYAPENAILIGDGGFAAHWSSVFWTVNSNEGRHYIANRGQAAIGYGLPAAVGAKIAAPDKPVITLSGDGGLGYSIMEMETAVRCKLPIILIVVNNMCFGYVKALEHFKFGEYIAVDLLDINYAEMAKIFGCYGVRITDPKDLDQAFQDALARTDKPSIIEVMVTTDPSQMLPGEDNRLTVKK